jgi:hypothetical protein
MIPKPVCAEAEGSHNKLKIKIVNNNLENGVMAGTGSFIVFY